MKHKVMRWQVVIKLAKERGWRKGAEVGVLSGKMLEHLLKAGLEVVAVDLWDALPGAPGEKNVETGHTDYHRYPLAEYEARVRKIAAAYPNRCRIIKKATTEAARDVEDGSLDFVFIDADHSTAAVEADIRAWLPKLKDGGCLMGHDRDWPSVRRAIDRLCPGWRKAPNAVWCVAKEQVIL